MGKILQGLLSLIQKLEETRPCPCTKGFILTAGVQDFLDDCSYIIWN